MIIIPESKEPLFASNVKRRGQLLQYFDMDGMPACVNFAARAGYRECSVCRNCCVLYMVHDDGTYTCSACGKFPRELLGT
jgi:hypothetical protein